MSTEAKSHELTAKMALALGWGDKHSTLLAQAAQKVLDGLTEISTVGQAAIESGTNPALVLGMVASCYGSFADVTRESADRADAGLKLMQDLINPIMQSIPTDKSKAH